MIRDINSFLYLRDFLLPFLTLAIIGIFVFFLNSFPLIKYTLAIIIFIYIANKNREDILLLLEYVSKKTYH